MAEEPKARPANVPSSLYGKEGVKSTPAKQYIAENAKPFFPIGGDIAGSGKKDNMPLIISIIALILAVASFGLALGGGAMNKQQLSSIASDLEAMQSKQLEVSAPIDSSVFIDEQIPLSEVMPAYTVPVDISIPLQGVYNGITPTGNIRVMLNETVPVHLEIPINGTAFSSRAIRINREIPVKVYASSKFTIRDIYGNSLQDIIDRLRNASR